jgi:hypothetical protein
MELIMPAEISGKIMTLIDTAKEKVTIVSPYNKISNWTKLTKRILEAKKNGVQIEWFIRKTGGNFNEIKQLGITPIEIENLHCKIYMNETAAVVTSMNLYEYSDVNSIDIGYLTRNESDYQNIVLFVNNYIRKKAQTINTVAVKPAPALNREIENNGFIAWIKEKFPQYSDTIVICKNKSGVCVEIEKFKTNYRLIFEPKGNYFRIDLRIDYDFNREKDAFNQLRAYLPRWTSILKNDVQAGGEMKRFKIDIKTSESINGEKWHQDEFKKFIPFFERAVAMYEADLI